MTKQTVALKTLISDFKLETVYLPERNIVVSNANVNRPGLPLTGFFEHFEPSRIQIIGKSESLLAQQPRSESHPAAERYQDADAGRHNAGLKRQMLTGNPVFIGDFPHGERYGQRAEIVVHEHDKGHEPGRNEGCTLAPDIF